MHTMKRQQRTGWKRNEAKNAKKKKKNILNFMKDKFS